MGTKDEEAVVRLLLQVFQPPKATSEGAGEKRAPQETADIPEFVRELMRLAYGEETSSFRS